MKTRLNQEEIKSLIEKYYEGKNEQVEVNLRASISYVGLYEDKTVNANIIIKRKFDLLGMDKEFEENISKDEVLGILNETLKDKGYQVTSLSYDTGISQGGSYIWEGNQSTAYFRGINLEVEKVNNVQKKLNI